jgi:hypothetical protein
MNDEQLARAARIMEISSVELREFNLQTIAVDKGMGVVCGVLADNAVAGLLHSTGSLASQVTAATLGGFAGPMVDLVSSHFFKSVKADLMRQRITGPLENAVKFSCIRHPAIKVN